MPGHEKKGSSDGQDPDPTPYLFLTFEMKREDMSKAYDAKKSYWVPDGDGGFVEGLLESENGAKVQVSIGHDKKVFKREQIQQVNPPKFEKCEDMSNLTYLNEASVLHNLRSRYQAKLIYVSFTIIESQNMIVVNLLHSDLLWSVLRCCQSVQEIPDLYQDCREALSGEEKERGSSSSLCHLGWSLQEHAEK